LGRLRQCGTQRGVFLFQEAFTLDQLVQFTLQDMIVCDATVFFMPRNQTAFKYLHRRAHLHSGGFETDPRLFDLRTNGYQLLFDLTVIAVAGRGILYLFPLMALALTDQPLLALVQQIDLPFQ
jgi:hypothetical protein